MPNYRNIIWDKESVRGVIAQVLPEALPMFDDEKVKMAIKSDLGRFCILYMYGGVYADVDIRPIRNCEGLFVGFDTVVPNRSGGLKLTEIGFMGSVPNNPQFVEITNRYLKKYPTYHKTTPLLFLSQVHEDSPFFNVNNNLVPVLYLFSYCKKHEMNWDDEHLREKYTGLLVLLEESSWSSPTVFLLNRLYYAIGRNWCIISIAFFIYVFLSIIVIAVLSVLVNKLNKK